MSTGLRIAPYAMSVPCPGHCIASTNHRTADRIGRQHVSTRQRFGIWSELEARHQNLPVVVELLLPNEKEARRRREKEEKNTCMEKCWSGVGDGDQPFAQPALRLPLSEGAAAPGTAM
eukprot:1243748-Rhodomonas_salina.1